MKHNTWLYEGVAVWFARQRSYVTRDEFLDRAAQVDVQPVIAFDANAPGAAPVEMRFAYAFRKLLRDAVDEFQGAIRRHEYVPPE